MRLIQLLELAQRAAMANVLHHIGAQDADAARSAVELDALAAGQEEGLALADAAQRPVYPLLDAYGLSAHYNEGFQQGVLEADMPEEEPELVLEPEDISDNLGDETFAYDAPLII